MNAAPLPPTPSSTTHTSVLDITTIAPQKHTPAHYRFAHITTSYPRHPTTSQPPRSYLLPSLSFAIAHFRAFSAPNVKKEKPHRPAHHNTHP